MDGVGSILFPPHTVRIIVWSKETEWKDLSSYDLWTQPWTPPDEALQGFAVIRQEFSELVPTSRGRGASLGRAREGSPVPQHPLTLCTKKPMFPGQQPHPDWTPVLATECNLKHSGI